MHKLRTWILKEEVNDLSIIMEDHKKAWKQYRCSIMSDGWTNGKSRCLINFLVNSPAGTWFMKSINASDTIKNGELMFKYLDEVVEEIGEENVVQVITDNASNYVNDGMRLMEKMRRLWWTPCAAHCIDLMLEDIGKLNVHVTILSRARQVVKFIYGHTWVLSLMKTFTKNHELLHPVITRFATAFLTLQSLYKQKQALIAMFSSEKWCSSTWAKKVEGVKTRSIVLFDPKFWPHVAFCIKTTVPLVSVLRKVDSEEIPAMGYIYELMDSTKENIAFHSGHYLNPQLRYGDKFSNVDEVRKGLFEMDRMLDYQEQVLQVGGCVLGVQHRSCKSFLFESLALLVVLWDVKEIAAHLNCVRHNTRLREQSLQRKQNVDPILVEEIDSDDEWIAEKEDPLLPLDLCWLQDNELFSVDAIRVVSPNSQETQASSDHMVSSHS
ncbi:hypothetical protein CK203_027947 [Vitis vinifera]|uniref:DUF659 domain-containing protein n=1 Tax=Vitis vinifera TaxID=29760 RepID=A0A438J3L8_VITVI|nr:hypothetical protein CK203_027947 [Vitis vinifera]